MLSYRFGTINDFHWELKPILSCSKPHTFSTFFGKRERKNALTQMFEIAISLHYKFSIARIWPRKILLSESVIRSYHTCQLRCSTTGMLGRLLMSCLSFYIVLSYIYTSNPVSYCYCVTIELLLFYNSVYEDHNVHCPRLCTRHIGYVL